MNHLQKTIVATAVLFAMVIPALASAQTSTTSIAALQAQIQALQDQIKVLQAQQRALVMEQKDVVKTLVRTLKEGVSGDDVSMLQALLASDPSIYPEGMISGFYGRLTAQAVKRFQKKHNFEQVGNVGPKTLKKLQELLRENPLEVVDADEGDDINDDHGDRQRAPRVVCHKVPPGHLVAPGWLKKNNGVQPIVPECQKLPQGIQNILNKNKATTTPPTSTTTPDTTAPVISALAASLITTNSAVVTWTTNEAATSQVYFGTMNPASVASSTPISTMGLVLTHSVALTGLTSGTTYYLIVTSLDAAGNMTTSEQVSFTTAVTPDTTAPVISAVTTSLVATTTATVSWTTDESATGNVYFRTVDPVVVASSTVVAAATAATGQSVTLSGLTANTTYYYVVDAKDASNNISTSAQQSFTTTN